MKYSVLVFNTVLIKKLQGMKCRGISMFKHLDLNFKK